MTTQSNVQALLESGVGLQNGAQSNTPSGINNGNPNTVYNWSSYIPSILRNAQGTPTGANFNLITSQPTASSPPGVNTGYTPPFTADPFAAMLISQLSQYRGPSASQLPGYGQGNSMINNILNNMINRYVNTPPPGSTAPPTTTPPVVTPPSGGGGNGVPQIPVNNSAPITGPTGPAIEYDSWGSAPISSGYGQSGGYGTGTIGGSSGSSSGTGSSNTGAPPVSWSGTMPAPVGGSSGSSGSGRFSDASPGGFWSDAAASIAQQFGFNGTMDASTPNTFDLSQLLESAIGIPGLSNGIDRMTGNFRPATPITNESAIFEPITTWSNQQLNNSLNTFLTGEGLGVGGQAYTNAANTTNAQLQDQLGTIAQQQMQARIDAERAANGASAPVATGAPATAAAGVVSAANPYGAYRTGDETAAQRDARYATEAQFVGMRDAQQEARNAKELEEATRGKLQ